MRNRHTKSNPYAHTILPLILAVVVAIIGAKYFFGETPTEGIPTGDFVTVSPEGSGGVMKIFMSQDASTTVTSAQRFFPRDKKMTTTEDEARVVTKGGDVLFLDKRSELAYSGSVETKELFTLLNGGIWAENIAPLMVDLAHMRVSLDAGSVVALTQNPIASNVYVLKGTARVQVGPNENILGIGQQLQVTKADTLNATKIAEKIAPIDTVFRTAEMYVRHGGDSYLTAPLLMTSGATTASGGSLLPETRTLTITSPADEASVSTDKIDIEGKISSAVARVTINDQDVSIDTATLSFIAREFSLKDTTNNLVIKALDSTGKIIEKTVLVVYSSQIAPRGNTATVTTYPLSDKDFVILAPTPNPYRTRDTFVRIEGRVPKGVVDYIVVNDFRLTKFIKGSSTWYYFANQDNGNLAVGINEYVVKYYGQNNSLLFTNKVIIAKDADSTTPTANPETTGTGAQAGQA